MEIGPKYRKIYSDLKAKIDDGQLKPGDKLSSTAQLRVEYGYSSTAINAAMLLLMAEGYVLGAPGIGRFVADE